MCFLNPVHVKSRFGRNGSSEGNTAKKQKLHDVGSSAIFNEWNVLSK